MKKILLSLCILGGLATAISLPQMYAQEATTEVTSSLSSTEQAKKRTDAGYGSLPELI